MAMLLPGRSAVLHSAKLEQPPLRASQSAFQIQRLQSQSPILNGGSSRLRSFLFSTQHGFVAVARLKFQPCLPPAIGPRGSAHARSGGCAVVRDFRGSS